MPIHFYVVTLTPHDSGAVRNLKVEGSISGGNCSIFRRKFFTVPLHFYVVTLTPHDMAPGVKQAEGWMRPRF